ncbi:MAG: hypothetical protein HKN09_07630 [Saprospiraceae bacterium]|nr:hypothetical protein [Saprospiraceae bacterium]
MKKLLLLCVTLLAFSTSKLLSQDAGFYFGPKAGLTIGMQNWNQSERDPLLSYHGALFMESIDTDYRGSLFAQIGYHTRGSSIRVFNINNGIAFNDGYKFRNLSLMLGAKKRIRTEKFSVPYYFFGVRLEYNVSNNLEDIQERFALSPSVAFYPTPFFVNKWVYGASIGGGIEFLGSAYVQPTIEFTISPDLSFQYNSPVIPNVVSPFNGQLISIPERTIRNVTFEVSFVVRFLREVIYID